MSFDEWKMLHGGQEQQQQQTFDPSIANHSSRRKNQLDFLALQAKGKEQELQTFWANVSDFFPSAPSTGVGAARARGRSKMASGMGRQHLCADLSYLLPCAHPHPSPLCPPLRLQGAAARRVARARYGF